MFEVSVTVVWSKKMTGSKLCTPHHHILDIFSVVGDFFRKILFCFRKCLVLLDGRFARKLFWILITFQEQWRLGGCRWKGV